MLNEEHDHDIESRVPELLPPKYNILTEKGLGAAIEVHRLLGPGLLESVYESALCIELQARGIEFERQVKLEIEYKGVRIGEGRIDFVMERILVVELKAIEALLPIHGSQLLTYLRAGNLQLGLLINFNVGVLKKGIRRVINSH